MKIQHDETFDFIKQTYDSQGRLHSKRGKPAVVFKDSHGYTVSQWYRHGVPKGPTPDHPDTIEEFPHKQHIRLWHNLWHQLHRAGDKPAMIIKNYAQQGRKVASIETRYYKNGLLHRAGNKPALTFCSPGITIGSEKIEACTERMYYLNDRLHNMQGPAVIKYSGRDGTVRVQKYYIRGKLISQGRNNQKAFETDAKKVSKGMLNLFVARKKFEDHKKSLVSRK